MRCINLKTGVALLTVAITMVAVLASTGASALAAETDPAAAKILQKMTDNLSTLKHFSVKTQNTLEDLLDSGQRVDYDISADILISRPDKLRSERKGDLIDQSFYYDGKILTLYNPGAKVYATESVPGTIEDAINFARDSLGLIVPVSDLIYDNAYTLLMEDVTSAIVVGKSVISGVKCDHLLFSRPGVDFQIWVADEGQPLPYKYLVTDTSTPALLSISTVMSNWNLEPSITDSSFSFAPTQEASKITFMRLDNANTQSH